MAILPFLQNMLLNIGTGHYIHVCMYTVYIIFRQHFSDKKNILPFQEKNLSRDYSLHTQSPTQRNPLSWTFCSTLIYVHIIVSPYFLKCHYVSLSTILMNHDQYHWHYHFVSSVPLWLSWHSGAPAVRGISLPVRKASR